MWVVRTAEPTPSTLAQLRKTEAVGQRHSIRYWVHASSSEKRISNSWRDMPRSVF